MEDSPKFKPQSQTLSHSSSRTRRTSSNSPEFEFWMVRNPSCPQPNLLSADELFVDGVLLPLRGLPNHSDPPDPNPQREPPVPDPEPTSETPVQDSEPEAEPGPGPELSTAPALTASKRWRDIFKKGEKKTAKPDKNEKEKEKEKKKERKGGGGVSSAELNINIWPFARSRSAGNTYTRPKQPFGAPATRKVNSAPCSRSNSTGESKSRKWPPASPGRAGVYLGRSSPVWQVRRGGSAAAKSGLEPQTRNTEKGSKKEAPESRRSKNVAVIAAGGGKDRALNLNVPMCVGCRSHLSSRSDENSAVGVGGGGGRSGGNNRCGGGSGSRSVSDVNDGGGSGVGGNGGAGGNHFNLRNLFSKKVY